MKCISILSFILLLLFSGSAAFGNDSERPVFNDFQVAYPVKYPANIPSSASPSINRERYVRATLDIDKKGRITGLATDPASDSILLFASREYVSAIQFEPARDKGKKKSSKIEVLIHLEPKRVLPEIIFPVDSALQVPNRHLYEAALERAGFEFPSIDYFPSYYCDLDWSDSTAVLHYVLLKLKLDEAGKVLGVEELPSSYSSFSGQLRSAVQYAKFTPLRRNGKALPSSPLLLISFFPNAAYPTAPWIGTNVSEYSLMKKEQLRVVPTQYGDLSLPIPAKSRGDVFTVPAAQRAFKDTISVYLSIDTLGVPFIYRVTGSNDALKKTTRSVFSSMRFYPETSFDGSMKNFEGLLEIYYSGSADVRFGLLWLLQ